MRLLLFIATILLLFSACDTKRKKAVQAGIQYTCPMHPQVVKDEPGECPICHMDLVAVQQVQADTTAAQPMQTDTVNDENMPASTMTLPNEIELSEEQVRLANIHADTISKAAFGNSMVLTGTVAFNEKNIEAVSSRVKGRIERLYYKNVGDYVQKGARVYELYSEELNSAKQEYILLLQKKGLAGNTAINYAQLLQAARHKLLLWGMTTSQVNALAQTQKAPYTTTFYSSAAGYITGLNVMEGAYVMEGQSMMRLANTSSVWIETQAYTSQLSEVNKSGSVTVQIPQLGNKRVTGEIEFASPEINRQTRINLLRVSVSNPGNELKPGMAAYIYLNNTVASGIALPMDAVIRNGKMAHVWLQTGANKFKMQAVTIGAESGNQVQVKQGLKEGDLVVTSGAYLLNSEYLLRNGMSTMEGMGM